jgi:putative serine protease PepD
MIDTNSTPQTTNPEVAAEPSGKRHRPGKRIAAIIGSTLLLALIFVIGGLAGRAWAGATASSSAASATTTTAAGSIATPRQTVAAKLSPSVVEVYVTLANGAALGSGVIVDSRGYIVTNNHVVTGASSIQVVLSNGSHVPAKLTGTDPSNDLAVIQIAVPATGLSAATLGDSAQLHVGQDVLAIGNPLGDTGTVTSGIVSALKRSVSEGSGGPTISNAIQTDAPINPGNSGGALVDMQGNVIGIPTLTAIDPEFNAPADGVGFAIPSNRVKTVMSQLIPPGTGR